MPIRACLLIITLVCTASLCGDQYSISHVKASDRPIVDSGRITYSMDIVFIERPNNYWVFYDGKKEKIVIDFYGLSLSSPKIALPKTGIFRDFTVANMTTRMSLSGERAQILVGTDPGWNIEAQSIRRNTIRVRMWKRLKPAPPKREPKAPLLLAFIATPVAVGLATFFIVRSLNE